MLLTGIKAHQKNHTLANSPTDTNVKNTYHKPSPEGEGVEAMYNLSIIAYIIAKTDEVF